MSKERKTKTTITRTPEKSSVRWEMSDEEIWGMEAYQVTFINSDPNVKLRPWSRGVNREAA